MVMLASLGKVECRAWYYSLPSEPWSFFSDSSLHGKDSIAEKLNQPKNAPMVFSASTMAVARDVQ
jgi:hypothetical protein